MDYELERTRKLGSWDGFAACTSPIKAWTTSAPTPNFDPDLDFCNFLIDIVFGKTYVKDLRRFWQKTIQSNCKGHDWHRRARIVAINLRNVMDCMVGYGMLSVRSCGFM